LVQKENGEYEVYIVELNPFAEFAGGGLFTWVNDMDSLLGKKPFEFRVLTACPKNPEKSMASSWAPYVYPEKA